MKNSKDLNLIKKTFTKQYSQFYCGLACLTSIIKYHGGEITQEKLRETSGTTLQGTSLLGLYQSAQKLGFEVKGYEADFENLKKKYGKGKERKTELRNFDNIEAAKVVVAKALCWH